MSAARSPNASTCFESLESRRLMSVSITVSNGVMHIEGSSHNDNVMIDQDDTTVFVFDDNILVKLVPVTKVGLIEFDAQGGNDRLRTFEAVTRRMIVDAGDGDDIIETGSGADVVKAGKGNDFVFSGKGMDHVEGGAGSDTMRGGNGNDLFRARDGFVDRLDGGAGFDTADVDHRFVSGPFGSTDVLISIESDGSDVLLPWSGQRDSPVAAAFPGDERRTTNRPASQLDNTKVHWSGCRASFSKVLRTVS